MSHQPHEQHSEHGHGGDPNQTPASVTIPGRFNGPPQSANGGYACGVTACLLIDCHAASPATTVTLHRPPPVERSLRVERGHEWVGLYDGDDLVSEARPAADAALDTPAGVSAKVSPEIARRVSRQFDAVTYRSEHVFPTCFTCGPERAEGDGLRIFPAPADQDRALVMWPWTPDASVAGEDGLVDPPVVWASLDCPSGFARFGSTDDALVAAVLGRMTVEVRRRPRAGEPLVVAGWAISDDGRKLLTGSGLWSADSELLAQNRAVWIVLSEEQQRAFGVHR
jgi:hypothetical protein